MLWLATAFGSRFLFACLNVTNSHFRTYFPASYAQQFFTAVYGVVFIPFLFLIIQPAMPSGLTWLWLALSGILIAVYVIPYFAALHIADTSVVTSLFAFNRVMTPFVASALIGEHLSLYEWLGLLITIPGGLLATYEPGGNRRFNIKALCLMLLSSLGLSLAIVIGKLAYLHISGIDGFPYIYVFCVLASLGFLLVPSWRPVLLENARRIGPISRSFAIQPLLFILSNLTLFLALSMTKATYVAVIGQFQPFFILLIVALMQKREGFNAREAMARDALIRKILAFLIMGAGTILMLFKNQ